MVIAGNLDGYINGFCERTGGMKTRIAVFFGEFVTGFADEDDMLDLRGLEDFVEFG